jgi:hypothetical protein
MKTYIKKIFLIAAALVFISTGVSFAHERKPQPDSYNSRRPTQGQFHKAPVYHPNKFEAYHYRYRHPGYFKRPYYKRHYYPKKYFRLRNYYRHRRAYPNGDIFFFGFSVR